MRRIFYEVPVWLDYFCLRQCQADFDLDRVMKLVGEVDVLVVGGCI